MKSRIFVLLTSMLLVLASCEKPLQDGNGDNPVVPEKPDTDTTDNPGNDETAKRRLSRPQLQVLDDPKNPDDFYVAWKKVPHAVKYAWYVEGQQDTPDTTIAPQIHFTNVGTADLTINVKAIAEKHSKDYKDSFYASINVSNRPMTPEYKEWLGEYELTTDKTIVHPIKDSKEKNIIIKDEPMTLKIKIDTYGSLSLGEEGIYRGYKVYGLSKDNPDLFSVAIFEYQRTNNLILLNQVTYGEPDESGFLKQWMGYGEMNGVVSIVPGPKFYPFTFSKKDGKYTVTQAKVKMKDGELLFQGYDIVYFNAQQGGTFYTENKTSAYGTYTLKKIADAKELSYAPSVIEVK